MTAVGLGQREHFLDRVGQLVRQAGFGYVARRAFLQRFNREGLAPVGSHQNDRNAWIVLPHRGDQFQTVHFRHRQIGDHQLRGKGLHPSHRLEPVGSVVHRTLELPFEQLAHQAAIDGRIVNHENRTHR